MAKHPPPSKPRRQLLGGAAALISAPWFIRDARAQAVLRPTPAQMEGPFYPVTLPADSDADLLTQGNVRYSRGQATWLEGTVTDRTGRPLRDAVVEIWQCDQAGHYHHPGDRGADPAFQGFGRVQVNAEGEYRFRTIRPAPYAGRTPHIHVKVKLGPRELLTTQLYVAGEPSNERDFLWRSLSAADRATLGVAFQAEGDGLRGRFPIVVAV